MEGCGSCGKVCGPTADVFVDAPISMTLDGQKYYYLYDGLGSITEVIDSNEDVVNTYRYSPFGQAMVKNETIYNPYQYTGRRYDEESGLYYYRARMYSPEMSRFTSNDPAREGANWYAYVGNNPVNARDPSGEFLEWGSWFKYFQAAGKIFGLLDYNIIFEARAYADKVCEDRDFVIKYYDGNKGECIKYERILYRYQALIDAKTARKYVYYKQIGVQAIYTYMI